ncbi:MAG: pyridoxamine 5'-phosphate oxidase family protein, partial [Sinobacterium sp.]|nr:pyridoxamine 5'-phosphate oxidase family protein [Sinobacterium sp.]
MKNVAMQARLSDEILTFINSRKSLMLSSLNEDSSPYASYAPFAITPESDGFYVLISTIAVHAKNLLANAPASVLIIEDE